MAKKQFGEPKLGDATSFFDRVVNEEAERLRKLIAEEGPRILNRPMGSKQVSLPDQVQDYERLSNDPVTLNGLYQELIQTKGLWPATLELVDYAEQMEKKRRET